MKGIKFMIAAALLAVATSASAQFANASKSKKGAKATASSLMAQKPIHEVSLYLQDGWGLGYQMRKDINQYVAWDVIGVSYMSGFASPADAGQVNFKLLGGRLNSPVYENCRLYTDLNLGYTLNYVGEQSITVPYYGTFTTDADTAHSFGLDFGVGVQIGKHFTLGYNLNYITAMDGVKSHWAKLSYIF